MCIILSWLLFGMLCLDCMLMRTTRSGCRHIIYSHVDVLRLQRYRYYSDTSELTEVQFQSYCSDTCCLPFANFLLSATQSKKLTTYKLWSNDLFLQRKNANLEIVCCWQLTLLYAIYHRVK